MGSNEKGQAADFESVKARLAEIADAVDDESLPLDEALDLYEEAVALGLQASDLLETGIVPPEDEGAGGEAGEPQPATGGEAGEPGAPAAENAADQA